MPKTETTQAQPIIPDTIFPDHVDERRLVADPHGRRDHWLYPPTGDVFSTSSSYAPPDYHALLGFSEEESHVADNVTVLDAIHKLSNEDLHTDAEDRQIKDHDGLSREELIDALLKNAGYRFDHLGQDIPE